MSGIQFELCGPLEADARQVMEWRNDPVTLAMSYHHAPKVWETFWPEYCSSYLDPDAKLSPVFAVVNDKRIGFLRFKRVDDHTVDISINLAPDERGKGLGTKIIQDAVDMLRSRSVEYVYAEALDNNLASIKAFQAAGFQVLGPKQKYIPDTGGTHSIVCFLKAC